MKEPDKILGLWDGHDSGAALLDREKIELALNEERLSRRKLEIQFPGRSLKKTLLDQTPAMIAYSTTDPSKTLARYFPFTKEQYYLVRRRKVPPGVLNRITKSCKYGFTTWKSNSLTRFLSQKKIKSDLEKSGVPCCLLHSYDHHFCHLAGAAFTAPEGDWTVVSLDGIGDGRSGAIAELRDHRLREIASIEGESSLGIFFEHVTNLMNMRELEDEGKVMALANWASPVPDEKNPLFDLIWTEGLCVKSAAPTSSMYRRLRKIFYCWPPEQFACMAQRALERCVTTLMQNAVKATGIPDVAYAGGVASNIKVNLLVNEMDCIRKLHVFPHMGDGGLALGAALALANEEWRKTHYDLQGCFLGPAEDSGTDTKNCLERAGYAFEKREDPREVMAEALCRNEIVLLHQGRMEWGPRALGNRSILALPDSLPAKDRLNLSLKRRVYYQPFCPSMLESDAEQILDCKKNFNPYMTIGFRVKKEFQPQVQAVMGVDGSCRPQVLPDDSPFLLTGLLRTLKQKRGRGIVLNTSLNIHGEPLCCTVEDTLAAFAQMDAKYAYVNGYWIRK